MRYHWKKIVTLERGSQQLGERQLGEGKLGERQLGECDNWITLEKCDALEKITMQFKEKFEHQKTYFLLFLPCIVKKMLLHYVGRPDEIVEMRSA
uniref:Uncharacterized protein n=1 Tax=Romanomermis culicivorax TaxID=13658 RepID=A0A915L0P0_ROMCU